MITDMERQNLISAAIAARDQAYSPYSHYAVGAALLTSTNRIITGCNIENASYGATNCAERTAFFKAISEGERSFKAIAITGGMAGEQQVDFAYPCGICRQVMQEFGGPDFVVIAAKSPEIYKEFTLENLLPFGFGGESIR